MYNFLTLVNSVNEKLNEVPLTSSNFLDSSGVYADNKNAINMAIRDINLQEFEWPFNHITKELTLTVDVSRYPLEADCKRADFNTFRIKGDDVLLNSTQALQPMDYEQYIRESSDMQYRPAKYRNLPKVVMKTPSLEFAVAPPPNKAYTLVYEYYSLPVDLEIWSDVPTIPYTFKNVIFNKAMQYAYMFRGDTDNAALSSNLYDKGLNDMIYVYLDRQDYAVSTMIWRP